MKSVDIVFIGAGNLATRLALEMKKKGFFIIQVFSRTEQSAKNLADKLNCSYTTDIKNIIPTAGIYIFSVKDDALSDLIHSLPTNEGLWVHTSGSVPMSVFQNKAPRYGVFYPLQTFNKDKEIDFMQIPICVEAYQAEDLLLLEQMGRKISELIFRVNSIQRQSLHLSAVFACNFTNHMYAIAAELLQQNQLPFDLLLPLIRETASKIESVAPKIAQTGPAIRFDKTIINKHMTALNSIPEWRKIYELLTESIYALNQKQKKNKRHE